MAAINAFVHAFWEMPPVTRMYMTASVLTTFLVQLEIISPFQLYFNPKLIFGSYQVSKIAMMLIPSADLKDANHEDIQNFNRDVSQPSVLETHYNILVLWPSRLQFSIQYYIYI